MSTDTLMFTATEHGQAMHAKVKAFIEYLAEHLKMRWQHKEICQRILY